MTKNPRNAALQVLLQIIKDGQSLTAALESQRQHITDRQSWAFLQALCYGVCRDYYCLQFILNQLLGKALKQKDLDIFVILLMGIYQLQSMRVKAYAAVKETVALAGRKNWAKSLINAVLRNFIRQQQRLQQLALSDIQAKTSHPTWMYELITKDWPNQAADLFTANNQAAAMVLRVNVQQKTRNDYLAVLDKHQIAASGSKLCATAIQLQQPMNVEELPGFSNGQVSVQDTAAQLAADLLQLQPHQTVLDMCAAPGGKTAAILESQPTINLTAIDIDPIRLNKVAENLSRLKLHAKLIAADASRPQAWVQQDQYFDRILLDAPCSALGVIRRHPDIKLLRQPTDLPPLMETQQRILDAAWSLLKPNGILLYATCSVLKQENEDQISAFLQRHTDAENIKIVADWGIERPFGRQILTGQVQMDGFYYAKLGKQKLR